MRETLRDSAARDTSRQISLEIGDPDLLNSVISSITPDDVELQSSQVESFVVHNHSGGQSTVDLSNFFLRYRLPALQHLSLSGMFGIANYEIDHTLTQNRGNFIPPTTSRLLSIIFSDPNLQDLELSRGLVPDCGMSASQVSLPNLKRIRLKGHPRNVLGLLNLLELPYKMDDSCGSSWMDSGFGSSIESTFPRPRGQCDRPSWFDSGELVCGGWGQP